MDPQKLIEQAGLLARHQQSWSQLLPGQAPAVPSGAFGEGLSAQGRRIAEALGRLHEVRQRQAERIQAEAQAATRLARDADQADRGAASEIARVLQ